MNKLFVMSADVATLFLAGCEPPQQEAKNSQAERAREVANSITFTDNAEIDNIKRRIEITSKPGVVGFIILLNEAGQPIMYEGVRGKVTSGGKRLTESVRVISRGNGSGGVNMAVVPSPSDEGTHGSSGEYIFYWNQDGSYRQWNGKYLYSDRPFRLRVEPLVVTVNPEAN